MSAPRLLIVSPTPPGGGSVNEILLRDLCRMYPAGRAACYAVINPGVTVATGWTPDAEADATPVRKATWVHKLEYRRLPALAVPAARVAGGVQTRRRQLPTFVDEAVAYGRETGAEAIWAILNSPIIYALANRVADRLGLPMYSTVWDPPERIVEDFRLDPLSRRIALEEFAIAMRRSRGVAVISEGMRDGYTTQYGVAPVIVRHGIRDEATRSPEASLVDPGTLTLGFAGSIYTPLEWQTLLDALDGVGWRIAGRDVRIRLFGVHGHVVGDDRPTVERRGWLPVEQVVDELSKVDLLYLPYRFDKEHEISVRMAFPTKMSTYIATGRPIFYHGPHDSTPRRFFDRYPAATCAHSFDHAEIIGAIERLVADPALYRDTVEAGRRARAEELNHDVTRRRFAEFLDLPVDELRS